MVERIPMLGIEQSLAFILANLWNNPMPAKLQKVTRE
jgi:hypothetical protein